MGFLHELLKKVCEDAFIIMIVFSWRHQLKGTLLKMELGIGVTKGKQFFTYICTFFTSIYLQRSLKEFFCSSLVVESKAKMFLSFGHFWAKILAETWILLIWKFAVSWILSLWPLSNQDNNTLECAMLCFLCSKVKTSWQGSIDHLKLKCHLTMASNVNNLY